MVTYSIAESLRGLCEDEKSVLLAFQDMLDVDELALRTELSPLRVKEVISELMKKGLVARNDSPSDEDTHSTIGDHPNR